MGFFAAHAEDAILQLNSKPINKENLTKLVGVIAKKDRCDLTTGRISLLSFKVGINRQVTSKHLKMSWENVVPAIDMLF